MEMKTSKPELPAAIAAYFAADAIGADATARCFTDDALVLDERSEHRGRAAIAQWKAEASAKYRYTSEPLTVAVSDATVIVTARLTGDFPGSPIELQYRFTLEGEKIARLEIAS
jgi:ketosteroid isomerase-like protein